MAGTIIGLTANPQGQPVLPPAAKVDLAADIANPSTPVRAALDAAGLGQGGGLSEDEVSSKVTAAAGTFGVSDFVNSWWCAPRSLYSDLRKTVYQGGVDAQGLIEIAKIDLRRKEARKIRLGLYEVDDHNVPAFLVEDDKPPIVAIVRHAVEKYVRVRIGTARHDVESLETVAEQLVEFPGMCTYAHLHRRPGTDTVALLTRNSDGWYVRISRDWGTTWEPAVRFHGLAYATFNVYGGVAHYAVTTHPTTTPNNAIRYFKISLETGVVTNAAGTVIGNLWQPTLLAASDMTYSRQSYDTDAGHNTNRVFDLLIDGSVLAMQLHKSAPEAGGMYGVYRRATTGASPSSSQSPNASGRGWVFEPIVASGLPVGYYVSSYVGGMSAGANANEVYLCRENSGTWSSERWTRANGSWSLTETIQTFTDGTKLGRPQVPWGAYGKGLFLGVEYHRYLETNFAGYYGDQRVIETGVQSSRPGPDWMAPSAPTNLAATAGTDNAVLTWSASTDIQAMSAYDVYNGSTRLATVTATTYTVTGLNAGQPYTFRVQAVDEAGNKSTFVNFPTVTPTAPLTRDPILVDAGSLALIDPTNQFGSWPAGVPTTTVPNLAAAMAAPVTGKAESELAFTVNNTLTATDGIVERTAKGGLHAIISQSTGARGRFFDLESTALRDYMAANTSHAFFLSAWLTPTRLSTEAPPTPSGRMVGFLTSGVSDVQSVRLVTNNKLSLAPSSSRLAFKESATPAPVGQPHLINAAHSAVNTAASASFVHAGNSAGATTENKNPSFVLYRVYMEDLTVSGRTYAQVNSIDESLYNAAFGAGGRFAADTYTAVSTLA